ncbi:DUF6114 domain-containing protein [Tuberibacillus sp. Marseille-P3662]|uniref:DUF6114 domain-containing protein n=1 Tax=Tuberibacillus sp. Marseille-P3662 TaxID=1965358 RepID=UPI00159393D1|nr:DUF6114 domain-containing protein [Tuberibacillus sp. Marseille-P3662]
MRNKEVKAKQAQHKLQKKQAALADAGPFKLWRNDRPFWGATITILAALLILYIPLQLYAIAFIPGSFAFIGLMFGGLMLILGVLAFFYPQFSTVFGIMTIFLSVLSIMGALGGFVIGTILGIIGGSFCIGWQKEAVKGDEPEQETSDYRNAGDIKSADVS